MQAHCSGEGSGQVVFRSRSGIKEKEIAARSSSKTKLPGGSVLIDGSRRKVDVEIMSSRHGCMDTSLMILSELLYFQQEKNFFFFHVSIFSQSKQLIDFIKCYSGVFPQIVATSARILQP